MERSYIAIDLKSFYASVECRERKLDPLTANLVVADVSRTEKTICLAVSPALKAHGIPGRARLFEVIQKVKEVNRERLQRAPGQRFSGKSSDAGALAADPALELDYIAAVPRMALYMEYSTRIYQIYLKYVAPEDIHVYSIDEVFIDVTEYLHTYGMTPHELAIAMIREVMKETGITAAAGIGTNLYLAKVAMDIVAKHMEPDADGVRIAELDEAGYRRQLWTHRPLTDFWRVGRGYARKLEEHGLYTMGDIARCSVGKETDLYNEDLLYKLFGINAELLIDHAWGWEPCTIDLVKQYKPENNSFSSGQVLMCPYDFQKAAVVVREMADAIALDLVGKGTVTAHKMFEKTDKGSGWGTNEGRIRPMKTTISNCLTVDGNIKFYASEAEFTDDPIEDAFFGCAGVCKIDHMEDKMIRLARGGFKHHTCIGEGHMKEILKEAVTTYLGYDWVEID